MPLHQRISQDRQALGLSQAELADRLGVSQQSVSKWEEGKSVPRGKRIRQLVSVLGNTSRTAALFEGKLENPDNHKDTTMLIQHHAARPPSAEIMALAALAQAAKDMAKAAQSIAESVERLTKEPPAHH